MDTVIHRWIVAGILVLSISLHLVGLTYPSQVIFDEVHFGKFVNAYCCTHEHFFDIHPPHAKLLIAGVVALTSYDGSFPFRNISDHFTPDVPVLAFRIVPALFGMILPLLIFVLVRQLGGGLLAAFLAAAAVLLDNALLVQTRIIALDGILLVAQFGALSAYLASRKKMGNSRWYFLVVAGILCGLAAGTKFTGLAALLLLGLLLLYELYKQGQAALMRIVAEGVVIVLAAIVIYSAGWVLHYALLTEKGSGDAWQKPTGNVLVDTINIHKKMLSANYNLAASHPYSSPWWMWPIMGRPVFYWQGAGGAIMYFIGNPVVWWGALAGLVAVVGFSAYPLLQGKAAPWVPGAPLLLAGYAISLAPLVRVPRALFLYHYATPLLFSVMLTAILLEQVSMHRRGLSRRICIWAVVLLLAGFILFSPQTFGFPVSAQWRTMTFWFPTWR